MHRYLWQTPPLLSIDHWNTTTLKNAKIPMADLPSTFKHRSLEHHYTASLSYIHLILRNAESHIKKYGDSIVQAHYHFTIFSISHMDIAPFLFLSLSNATDHHHAVEMLILDHHRFEVLSFSN